MKNRAIVWVICGLSLAAVAGCNNDNARDLKREQDRLAIDLARVTKERDQYRQRLGQMQSSAGDNEKKLQQQVDDLETRVKSRDDELAEMRRRLRAAEDAAQPALPTSRRAQP
jgi:cell division septum initiation protein DivIVA